MIRIFFGLLMCFYSRFLLLRRIEKTILPKMSENTFTILYGSQTGQAKAIAEEIFEQAEGFDLKAKLLCLSTTDKKFAIEKEKCVVFVVSTTGDGEPPDTVTKFWRRLRKKTLGSTFLKGLHYTLLGLGDTNYTNFCNCSKNLNSRLLDLGATHFYPPGFADDAVGLEIVVEPWIDELWPALLRELSSSKQISENEDDSSINDTMSKNMSSEEKPQTQSNENYQSTLSKDITDGKDTSRPLMDKDALQNDVAVDMNNADHSCILEETTAPVQDDYESTPSLRISRAPLSESDLSIPILPAEYLCVSFTDEFGKDILSGPWQGGTEFTGSASPITEAKIVGYSQMTKDDAVKTAYCLTLDTGDTVLNYHPGDSFGIICPNNKNEVDGLISRLDYQDLAEKVFTLAAKDPVGNKKRAKGRPDHIPQKCTIRQALTSCLEIRSVPRKAFLRVLCEYTSNALEKRRLQELCSKEGAADYSSYIREPHVSFIDILNAFPSCKPPFERLLEHLPRLLPRPYSVACSPSEHPTHLRFVFNIVKFTRIENVRDERYGLCTGWLQEFSNKLTVKNENNDKSLESNFRELSLSDNLPKVNVVLRNHTGFHLPHDTQSPLIMIGPGTGVAPFVGFLQHRRHMQRQATSETRFGVTWLFYGCRHKERDFLFREELTEFERTGVLTKLIVSFSRDVDDSGKTTSLKYVQDNIRAWEKELCDLICDSGAFIFVCGDAKNMAKNVLETFIDVLQSVKGLSHEEAKKEIWKLRQEHRYVEEVWT
ncbi:methionine synthase reductase-like [Dendronephthya gigantea]|uniref:methionine synthase reductase-like n=1 Tax=Dendronephthya gigantea TaxID=151771 RepID=UPI00106ABB16|nr:methionine synthase reductase-like [Dendronephthya gigantea]